jgi:hypothetical protein
MHCCRKKNTPYHPNTGKRLFDFVSRFGTADENSSGWFTGPSRQAWNGFVGSRNTKATE